MVSARDFVYVSKKDYKGQVFVMGGRSVEFKEAPSSSKIVRAVNGAGCQMVSPTEDPYVVELLWLMDCDYKVWEAELSCLIFYCDPVPRAGCRRECWTLPCRLPRPSSLTVSEISPRSLRVRGNFEFLLIYTLIK